MHLKAILEVSPISDSNQDEPAFLKTRSVTPTHINQDHLILQKEGFDPTISLMSTELPSTISSVPPIPLALQKRERRLKKNLIIATCLILLALIVVSFLNQKWFQSVLVVPSYTTVSPRRTRTSVHHQPTPTPTPVPTPEPIFLPPPTPMPDGNPPFFPGPTPTPTPCSNPFSSPFIC
jgi:hypothetical protein